MSLSVDVEHAARTTGLNVNEYEWSEECFKFEVDVSYDDWTTWQGSESH